jgi:selenocysteine lyase/cysteine desulfurase
LEAGTHNIPGIAGLLEGIRFVRNRGEESILRREKELTRQAVRGLSAIPGVTLYAASRPEDQSGVLSLQFSSLDCEEAGERLGQRGIAVRAGLHCAPYAHESAGTKEKGTVRVSFSDFNTPAEVRTLVWEVSRLTG